MVEPVILTSAYILDLIIGDPRWLPHPVRFIGLAIERMERVLRKTEGRRQNTEHRTQNTEHRLKDKFMGILLVIIIVGSTYGLFYLLSSLLLGPNLPKPFSYLALLFVVYLASTTIATRDLIKSGRAVIDSLNTGNEEEAKNKLSMIVGRDTKQLDDKGILKATIETLSENASDGIIAPMFYFAIGGLPLAMAYKAINTLDSMVGYRNERYINFGWASAKLDDIANYIPARITGMLIVIATFIITIFKYPENASRITHHALRITLRDGRKHLSPNSGIPEAAMAGALGVRLGGPSMYSGVLVEKPYIGEEKSEVRSQKSEVKEQVYLNASGNAISIIKLTSLLGFGLALILLYLRTAI
ncbi:MAG: cobalamin biosynthesis protein CobD [Nitrospirae bacterium]|nr:cobalamin biosynthesis protein CobD [Nitrospirota bacterium]